MLLPGKITWDKWGDIFTDIKLWTPVIKEICKKEDIDVFNIRGGYPGTNAVYILDDRYVIKIYPPQCHNDFNSEVEMLLALDDDISMPRIYCRGVYKDRIDWPYLIMEYKAGEAIRDIRDEINDDNLYKIYDDLGKIVKRIHNTDIRNLTKIDTSYEGWRGFIYSRKKEIINYLENLGILSNKVIEEINCFLKDFIVYDKNLLLLNSDLTEDHLLLTKKQGVWNISALIDLADGRIGDSEYEWVALWFGLLDRNKYGFKRFLNSYDSSIDIDEEFINRVMGYTLLHQFGGEMINNTLNKLGCKKITSFKDLKDILWFRV